MNLYPVCLKLENVPCCVIGGGEIALRKIESLLACGAQVSVISLHLCKKLKILAKKNKFSFQRSKYQKKFLRKKFLIIAATNNSDINKKIAHDAFSLGLLVNVVDSPGECNFYAPSVLRKNGILMAVSTQGAFPGLAKKIKNECEPVFTNYASNFQTMSKFREIIKKQFKNEKLKKKAINLLMQPCILAKIQNGKIRTADDLKSYLKNL